MLVMKIKRPDKKRFIRHMAIRLKRPPHRLYSRLMACPAKKVESRMRARSTIRASAGLKLRSKIKVTILESPSLMPEIGTESGMALSITKIVRAITVNTDRVASFFMRMKETPLKKQNNLGDCETFLITEDIRFGI